MDFQEALDYMQGLRRFGIKLGNERFAALLERLGNPQARYGVAHVTGTKGKGSTTALVASILQRHGFNVGGYFSPYVFDVRERVQLNGRMISREDFARLVTTIRPHVEEIAATPLGQATEFELKTAVGFAYFGERNVDLAVVEVGIGGRLDATNIVDPLVTVITNVGLDHTHILGDTVEKIAFEKAGIIKPGVPCVCAAGAGPALDVIARRADGAGAPLLKVAARRAMSTDATSIFWHTVDEREPGRPEFIVTTRRRDYARLRCGLLGSFQQANAACAIGAAEETAEARGVELKPEIVREALAATTLPGRMQVVRRAPTLMLDGAHNAIAAEALRDELIKMEHGRLLLVIGMVAGHEPEDVVDKLAPLASTVFATQPAWNRALPAERIADAARRSCADVRIMASPNEAARRALAEAGPEDLVVVTGSFYVVGDLDPTAWS